MKLFWLFIVLTGSLLYAIFGLAQNTAPTNPEFDIRTLDSRYCGTPTRDNTGKILRSTSELTLFKMIHPCPSTGLQTGNCPGWAIDHVIPLACGGCDKVNNMQWLPDQIKNAEGKYPKDRWERKVYAAPQPFPDTDNCVNTFMKE